MKLTKNIRMPKKLLKKWLEALRSGKYKQGQNRLGSAKEGYCCLGLLQRVADGRVGCSEDSLLSQEWIKSKGIIGDGVVDVGLGEVDMEFSNFPAAFDSADTMYCQYASEANDIAELSFEKIADLVELNVEGY